MEPLPLMLTMLVLVVQSHQAMETLEDILVYPVEPPTKIQKRDTKGSDKSLDKFIEETLVQHSQALEHLLVLTQKNEELTKALIENLGAKVLKPEMPEKVQFQHQTRGGKEDNDENENPIVKMGKRIPVYGNLLKSMVLKDIQSEPDLPQPLIEQLGRSTPELMSRRSFDGQPVHIPSLRNEDKISPWCSVAMVCRRTMNPVCGYDDNFGYGKFDDICHMLQVNCHWKFNFALVPSCRVGSTYYGRQVHNRL